jgi:hypothetical protein
MELLDGSDKAPAKTMEVEDENKKKITFPNPAYGFSIKRDQQVVSYVLKSLSPEIQADVLGLEHADKIWQTIAAIFSTQPKHELRCFVLPSSTPRKEGSPPRSTSPR